MSLQKPWAFSQNIFLTVTHDSFRLAVRISAFHYERLKTKTGDPVYDAMLAKYEPLHQNLLTTYNAWKKQGGSQLGQTLDFTNLLLLLRGSKIRKWDITIQGVYDENSSQYKALLPNRRTPFQTGKQMEILSAVDVLAKATTDDAKLSSLAQEIKQFHTDLQTAFDSQKQSIGNTSLSSDALEKARVAMCIGQFADLGGIIQYAPAEPDTICYFFDQLAIREGTQVIFTGSCKPTVYKNIVKHTFAAGDKLKLENEGLTELCFYLAAQKDGKPGGKMVAVKPGDTVTVGVEDLGDLADTFLMVYNPGTDVKGDWTVEFV